MTRVVVARHGEAAYESSEWNGEGGSLTPLGRTQARALGEELAGAGVVHVWTSTLARAVQTGDDIRVQDAGSAGEESLVQRQHSDGTVHRGAFRWPSR